MKRLYAKRLLLALLTCLPLCANAYDFEVDGIFYDYRESEVWVTYETTSYNSYSGDVTIPNMVTYKDKTYTVSGISDFAFYGCTSLKNIALPDALTYIEGYAFYYCSSLTNITLPDALTYIGDYAFFNGNSRKERALKYENYKAKCIAPLTNKLDNALHFSDSLLQGPFCCCALPQDYARCRSLRPAAKHDLPASGALPPQ